MLLSKLDEAHYQEEKDSKGRQESESHTPTSTVSSYTKTPRYTTITGDMCRWIFLSRQVLSAFSALNKHTYAILIIKLLADH